MTIIAWNFIQIPYPIRFILNNIYLLLYRSRSPPIVNFFYIP